MGSDFDVLKSLSAYVSVAATETAGAALNRLRGEGGEFILVTETPNRPEEEQPVCVLREAELLVLARDATQELSRLLEKGPGLLVLAEGDLGEEQAPREILLALAAVGASGCVVRFGDGAVGVISADAIARSVWLEDVADARPKSLETMVSARTYVCRKCAPPRYKRPRIGGAPTCDVWSHGIMQVL